jgi:ribosomal protein L10
MPLYAASMRKVFIFFLSLLLLLGGFLPVRAQSFARLELYNFRTGSFPQMSAGLDVYDSAGNLVTGLSPDSIVLLEDGQPRPLDKLEELQPGVFFALALNPGPYFAYRDANAVTRYDKVYKVLQEWAATHPDSLGDDLTFVPTDGTLSAHLTETAAFAKKLEEYSPPLQVIQPSLDTLSRALDAVSERSLDEGMKRTVLFVTSPPDPEAIPTLQNLAQRASAEHIRVNVWIVTSESYFKTSGATALKDLAIQTGGQYILFSGVEPLPGLEIYLAPLRHTYRLAYTSTLLTSGSHTLAAQVDLQGETVTSAGLSFNVDIQPPNPILVAPPDQVIRQAPDERTTDTTAFMPARQAIEILIEFPDGRARPLSKTILFVDDKMVAINTAAPFDSFSWDLSGYADSGQHLLKVEAVDVYGLSRTSLGVPVVVTVIHPARGLLPFLSRNRFWVMTGGLTVAGVLLVVILVSSGRKRRRSRPRERDARRDPLTQPVWREQVDRNKARILQWIHPSRPAEAYLVRMKEDGQSLTAPPVTITIPEMTFGSDPLQVTRILDDPSVSPLHARLVEEEGEFILYDEKSAAGTWVNYELLSAPRHLHHGDVLQIGRFSYRFMLRKPPEKSSPKVTPTKP